MATKKWAYLCVTSSYPQVEVGQILLYRARQGPSHFESIFKTNTMEFAGGWSMVRVGPCWVVDGKVQFEEPPLERGLLTDRIMGKATTKPRKTKPPRATAK